jgi:PleD family two-component response regulator
MSTPSESTIRLSPPASAAEAAARILLVTASEPDAQRIAGELERSQEAAVLSIARAVDLAEARRRCLENFGVILVDLALPGADGPEGIPALKLLAPQSVVVALARYEKEPAITLALRAGADEFVIKGLYNAEVLLTILEHARARNRLTPSSESTDDYLRLSRDAETRLPNAELFSDVGRYAAGVAFRSGGQLALCEIVLNASQQTDASVPAAVTTILREATRETDALARLGPHHYAVLFGPIISPGEVERVMRRIVERIQKVPTAVGAADTLAVSVGVAQFPKHADTFEQLLINAGLAALQAGRGGPGTIVFYQLSLRGGIE